MSSSYSASPCVARHPCNTFIWWTCLTWPWRWTLLSIKSTLICCLLHPLGCLLAKFGLASVISEVVMNSEVFVSELRSRQGERWRFWHLTWPWPEMWHLKRFLIVQKCLSRAFACCRTHLPTASRSRVRWGGGDKSAGASPEKFNSRKDVPRLKPCKSHGAKRTTAVFSSIPCNTVYILKWWK